MLYKTTTSQLYVKVYVLNKAENFVIVIFGPSILTQSITIIKKKINLCSPYSTLKTKRYTGHKKTIIQS